MRLINVETLKLEEYFGDAIPSYAILSHTWGSDTEELTFRDFETLLSPDGARIQKPGIGQAKLKGSCEQAKKDGLGYLWMDTCCIDKSNAVELSEAINSMFQWYAEAYICYAYLWDVPQEDNHQDTASKFFSSRWFQRGWTLQELLAPKQVYFYDLTWSLIGTKASMSTVIQKITGIPRPFLLGLAALHEASVAQRMSWAAKRVTKRKEDTAYCLLGMFNVMMPMIYGEGEQAFRRLQQEIMQTTKDDSILAWGLSTRKSAAVTTLSIQGGLLATFPSDFANCGQIRSSNKRKTAEESFEIFSGRLKLHLPLYTTVEGKTYGLLNCGPEQDTNYVIGIPLGIDDTDPEGFSGEYVRPQGFHSVFIQKPKSRIQVKALTIKVDSPASISVARTRRHWFYIEDTGETGMDLVDVFPRDPWQVDHAMIMTDINERNTQRFLARFRAQARTSSDLLLVLDFVNQEHPRANCHTLAIPRDADLEDEYIRIRGIEWEESGAQNASDGLVCASISLNQESVAGQPMFVIRVHPDERRIHSGDGLWGLEDDDEYSTLIDHDMRTHRSPIMKLAILLITRKAMVVLLVSSIFTIILVGVVLGLFAPHSSNMSCTTLHNHSGLAAANLTDSKGYTHRFVFFQECDSSLVVNRWDSENRTWTRYNLNKILLEGRSPIEASPGTSLAAAATDETFREVRLWYFGPGFLIHSVWLNDPAMAGNWAKGDTLDLAVSNITPLAAAWLSCTTKDCISCWTLALRSFSMWNPYSSGRIYNVSDTSTNQHTHFAMAFSGVLSLGPQLNNGIANGLVVVWQDYGGENINYDRPLNVVSFGDSGEWRLDPTRDLGFNSFNRSSAQWLPRYNDTRQSAITLLDHWHRTLVYLLLPDGTVTGCWWDKVIVNALEHDGFVHSGAIPEVQFLDGPPGPSSFSAIAMTLDGMFYGISNSQILEYSIDVSKLDSVKYAGTAWSSGA